MEYLVSAGTGTGAYSERLSPFPAGGQDTGMLLSPRLRSLDETLSSPETVPPLGSASSSSRDRWILPEAVTGNC